MDLQRIPSPFSAQEAATVDTPAPVVAAHSEENVARLKQAALKFEAFFVAQMMQQMRKATAAWADKDSALNDQVNQAPLAMADNAVADALSARGAFGIADVLVRQMAGGMPSAASPFASSTLRKLS